MNNIKLLKYFTQNIILSIILSMKPHVAQPPLKQNLKLKQKSQVITSITHASQRSRKAKKIPIVSGLNIDFFKTKPCSNQNPHLYSQCCYYHTAKDCRRLGNFYTQQICPFIEQDKICPEGQYCQKSHSKMEQLYHIQAYKKKFCSYYPHDLNKCEYGRFCPHAHTQEEIKTQLVHNYQFDEDFYMFFYKTIYCPYIELPHDHYHCVYSHSTQDHRRSPQYYFYAAGQLCTKGYECQMSHNWLQLLFHPNNYKTNICEDPYCKRYRCPFYHFQAQKRVVSQVFHNGMFHYVPRNRITKNIFKYSNQQQHFQPRSMTQIPKSKSTLFANDKNQEYQTKNGYVCKTDINLNKQRQAVSNNNTKQNLSTYLDQQQVQSQPEQYSSENQSN